MEDNELLKKTLEGNENEDEKTDELVPPATNIDENISSDDSTSLPEANSENPVEEKTDEIKTDEINASVESEPDVTENKLAAESTENELVEENGAVDTSIKTFTQEDVDKLVGDTRVRTREKTFRYIYDRYGVKNEEELDGLIANAQKYDTQKELYDADKMNWKAEKDETEQRLTEMSEQIALMQSDIAPERYEDAKLILKGKGLEVTLENIASEMSTHPEWKKEEIKEEAPVETPAPAPVPEKPTMRIKALGNEQRPAPEMSEEEQAQKLFKMKW